MKFMEILGRYAYKIKMNNIVKTIHYKDDRNERENFILEKNLYDCNILDTFVVDKQHHNGLELHCVTDSGLIIILNKRKYESSIPCHVTTLIARPGQIKRYYSPFLAPQVALESSLKNRTFANGDSKVF